MKKLGILFVCVALVLSLYFGAVAEEEKGERMGLLTYAGVSEEEFYNLDSTMKTTHVYYDDLSSMLLGLERNDIDFCSLPLSTCNYIMEHNPGQYKAVEFSLDITNYRMLTLESQSELMTQLNTALVKLSKNGTLKELREAYLGSETPSYNLELPVFEGAPTYRVLLTGDLPPMDYVSADGKADGYNIALLSAISEYLQVNFEIVIANAASRAIMLTTEKVDIVFWALGSLLYEENNIEIPEGCIASYGYMYDGNYDLSLAEK